MYSTKKKYQPITNYPSKIITKSASHLYIDILTDLHQFFPPLKTISSTLSKPPLPYHTELTKHYTTAPSVNMHPLTPFV